MKVLVIDDDELIRLTIGNMLRKTGYTIFEAGDGNEGLDIFKREYPGLVITDILMPNKEGLETINDLRGLDAKVKIIAISGGGSVKNMSFLQLARKMGADHILTKPIKPDELFRVVGKLMVA